MWPVGWVTAIIHATILLFAGTLHVSVAHAWSGVLSQCLKISREHAKKEHHMSVITQHAVTCNNQIIVNKSMWLCDHQHICNHQHHQRGNHQHLMKCLHCYLPAQTFTGWYDTWYNTSNSKQWHCTPWPLQVSNADRRSTMTDMTGKFDCLYSHILWRLLATVLTTYTPGLFTLLIYRLDRRCWYCVIAVYYWWLLRFWAKLRRAGRGRG